MVYHADRPAYAPPPILAVRVITSATGCPGDASRRPPFSRIVFTLPILIMSHIISLPPTANHTKFGPGNAKVCDKAFSSGSESGSGLGIVNTNLENHGRRIGGTTVVETTDGDRGSTPMIIYRVGVGFATVIPDSVTTRLGNYPINMLRPPIRTY
jgi:hypothetical protein